MTQIATPNIADFSKADLISLVQHQQETIRTQREQLQWYKGILSNKELPVNMRLALIATKELADTRKPGDDGFMRAHLPALAETVGVSASTMSRAVQKLADCTDAVERRVEPDKNDPYKSIVYLRPKPLLERPREIAPIVDIKRHGGDHRVFCQACGSENIVEQKKHICADCGTVVKEFELRLVNPPDDTPLHLATGEHTQEESTIFVDLAAGETLASTSPLQDAISSEIQVPPSDCNASLSPCEIESQAAQLLVEIAGTTPQHIKMCKDGDQKYISIHRAVHQGDTLAHLRGYQTIGATLRHSFGLTRALCFDVDTSEAFQRLRASARLLASADDFKPLLSLSPAIDDHQGSGHLWVIFDKYVDVYSALQTVYQYAPELREVKEYWPREGNNRVRLPGGKYVRPGVNAWCKLEDPYGNELSHDGAGAALVLLQYQTPATIINAYEKPAPVLDLQSERSERKPAAQAGYLEKNVAKQIIADFNASHSWDEIAALCGGFNRRGKFLATWRGDKKPDVSVNPRTDLAKDFARMNEPAMDKYDVWCHIQAGINGNWEAFKTRDLDERCKQLRDQERKAS